MLETHGCSSAVIQLCLFPMLQWIAFLFILSTTFGSIPCTANEHCPQIINPPRKMCLPTFLCPQLQHLLIKGQPRLRVIFKNGIFCAKRSPTSAISSFKWEMGEERNALSGLGKAAVRNHVERASPLCISWLRRPLWYWISNLSAVRGPRPFSIGGCGFPLLWLWRRMITGKSSVQLESIKRDSYPVWKDLLSTV